MEDDDSLSKDEGPSNPKGKKVEFEFVRRCSSPLSCKLLPWFAPSNPHPLALSDRPGALLPLRQKETPRPTTVHELHELQEEEDQVSERDNALQALS